MRWEDGRRKKAQQRAQVIAHITYAHFLALLATVGAVAIICARTPPTPPELRELFDDTDAVDDPAGDPR